MTPSSEKPKSPARRFAPLVVALAVFVTAMVLGPQAKVQRQLSADFTLSAAGSPYAGEALNRCKDELRRALGRAMPDAAGDMQIETGESPQPHTARVGLKINDVGTSADARQVIAKLEALPGERVYLFERQVEAADTSLEKERQTALDQLRRTTALIDAFWKKHLAEDESAAGKDPPVVVEKEKDPPREEPALHPDWIQVRQRLTKLEQRLTKITKTHTASHPELIQLQEKVAAVRTELHDTPKFAEKRRGPTIELQPPGQSIATPKPKEDVGETKDRREKRLADYRRLKAEQAAAQEAVRRATTAARPPRRVGSEPLPVRRRSP